MRLLLLLTLVSSFSYSQCKKETLPYKVVNELKGKGVDISNCWHTYTQSETIPTLSYNKGNAINHSTFITVKTIEDKNYFIVFKDIDKGQSSIKMLNCKEGNYIEIYNGAGRVKADKKCNINYLN